MRKLIAEKKEMTQVFGADGVLVPVTVLDITGNTLVKAGTNNKDMAVLGAFTSKNPSKSFKTNYVYGEVTPKYVTEVEKSAYGEVSSYPHTVNIESDLVGRTVHVTALTKGKGFQGVMKRWGFAGGKKTHGQSDRMRAPGSIGSGTTPGRVYKGKKMAGRMGGKLKTVTNLLVVDYIAEKQLLVVRGAVPGPKNGKVIITIIQ